MNRLAKVTACGYLCSLNACEGMGCCIETPVIMLVPVTVNRVLQQ